MFRTTHLTTLAAAASLLACATAHAAIDASWTAGNGNWSGATNWSTNPSIPGAVDDIARLGGSSTSVQTTLDQSGVVLGQLINERNTGWTINTDANNYALTFQVSSGSALIKAQSTQTSTVTINPNVIIASDLSIRSQKADAQSQNVNLNGTLTGTGNVTLEFTGATGNNASGNINIASMNTVGTLTSQGNNSNNGTMTATVGTIGSNVTNLTKTGSHTLVLTSANSYTGTTTLSGGITRARRNDSLSGYATPGNVSVASGATLALNVGGTNEWTSANIDTLRNNATFSSGSILGIDTTNAAGGFNYGSNVGGNLGIRKFGNNTLTLSGNNSYTGTTTVSAGTLTITNSNALGSGSADVTVASGAVLQLDGTGGDIAIGSKPLSVSGTGISSGGGLRNLAGNNSWAGAVTAGLSGTSSVFVASGSSLNLSGGITSSGAGTRTLSFLGSGSSTINGISNAATALTVTAGTVTVTGSVINQRAFTVSGGVLNFNTNHTSTNTLSNFDASGTGSLFINGTVTTAGNLTVASTSTLGGSGTIKAAAATISGTLRPGNSAGTLTIDNSVTLASTTVSNFELDTAASYDRLWVNTLTNAAATLTFAGTLNVIDNGVAFANGQVFDLFNWGSNTAVSGTFSAVNLPTLTGLLTWKEYTPGVFFDYATGQIEVTLIPEPASLALMAAGTLLMLPRRKRMQP
jgi:fibronectin-binding autotransporter adhesin